MKKLILILAFAIGLTANSQKKYSGDNISYDSFTIITAPGTYIDFSNIVDYNYKDDGFNFGIQYEHQWDLAYVGGELFFFPDLNDISYTHFIVRTGFNQEYGRNMKYRWNVGFRGGRIWREGYEDEGPHALLGLEIGAQVTLPFGMFGKIVYAYDMKSDSAIWHEDNHKVNSLFAGIGYRF